MHDSIASGNTDGSAIQTDGSAIQRGRGRPSIVDAMLISEAALSMWEERGYAATGWKEIAQVTGVSARTLMRHFGSRAEIAWLGVMPATERMTVAAKDIPTDAPLGLALRQMIQASVSRSPKVAILGPSWIRLVADEPELAMLSPSAHSPWIAQVASYIADRRPDLPTAIARAIAVAYQSATFSALTEWARDATHSEAADAVDAMLAHLDLLTAE